MSRSDDLTRIREALATARAALDGVRARGWSVGRKAGGDPVTDADNAINDAVRRCLPCDDEGWLSEETVDDSRRLERRRVWVVDPLDGTQEFVAGIPEWCVSIGLVEDGRPVAGGILNPATDELVLGSVEGGVTLNGSPARARELSDLSGVLVLASRSEVRRGEWQDQAAPYGVRPMGSVAYKMARVAAGLSDATWTLSPKHEWDVAAGAALVLAGGGSVCTPDGAPPLFNRAHPWLPGLIATPQGLREPVLRFLAARPSSRAAPAGAS